MRIRATAAAAVIMGVVALTAAAMPAAQASSSTQNHRTTQAWKQVQQLRAAQPAAGAARTAAVRADATGPLPLAVSFSNVKVDTGKTGVPVGTTNTVHVPYTFTLTATSTSAAPIDISSSDFYAAVDLYRGSATDPTNDLFGDYPASCSVTASTSSATGVTTTANCTGSVDIYPQDELQIVDAGASWHSVAWALDLNGDPNSDNFDPSKISEAELSGQASPAIQRYSKLTVNASPEPVVKGKTITIVGKLSRANWDTHVYAGYTVQPVKLQFRKAGSTTYTTLKTVTTDSHGDLKTTFKASVDGYWRYSFAGTSTTPAVSAAGDYVDVK